MSRVALEALVGCMFSEGLGDPNAVCDATTRYYTTRSIDPFDVLGLPDFVPRFARLDVEHVLPGTWRETLVKGWAILVIKVRVVLAIVRFRKPNGRAWYLADSRNSRD